MSYINSQKAVQLRPRADNGWVGSPRCFLGAWVDQVSQYRLLNSLLGPLNDKLGHLGASLGTRRAEVLKKDFLAALQVQGQVPGLPFFFLGASNGSNCK